MFSALIMFSGGTDGCASDVARIGSTSGVPVPGELADAGARLP